MLKLIAAIMSLLASVSGLAQPDGASDEHAYANQTTYGDPATTPIRKPPAGYELVFLENVGRHGSRSQTGDEGEKRARAIWSVAARGGQLTALGARFDDDLEAFQTAERALGYGRLSATGRAEWLGIGRRTASNYRDFWTKTAANDDDIEFETTSIDRTQASAAALRQGLAAAIPGLDLKPRTTDDRMRISKGASNAGNTAIAQVVGRPDVRMAARHVLRRLYTATYVDRLSDPVGKALDIYALYAIAPGMSRETEVGFSQYVPLADARLLGLAKDAQNFYRYGPGVQGESSSYRAARPVLADFFSELDERVGGGDTAAVFRIAHGETTMPFAALTRMPGSAKQASAGAPFSYGNNPWRGFVAGRMAGNIEWAAYRNTQSGGGVLVTVRYNEQPVQMASTCTPSDLDPYFYSVAELKRCLL
jgi:hypothetical protein